VNSILDIGRTYPWDKYPEDKVQEEMQEFRDRFEEEIQSDIPLHPYKIYRNIVESQELSLKEQAALHHLKDEYTEKWKEKKRGENQ